MMKKIYKNLIAWFCRDRLSIISITEYQNFKLKVGETATIYNHGDEEQPPFAVYRRSESHIVLILNPWKLCKIGEYSELFSRYEKEKIQTFFRNIKPTRKN